MLEMETIKEVYDSILYLRGYNWNKELCEEIMNKMNTLYNQIVAIYLINEDRLYISHEKEYAYYSELCRLAYIKEFKFLPEEMKPKVATLSMRIIKYE